MPFLSKADIRSKPKVAPKQFDLPDGRSLLLKPVESEEFLDLVGELVEGDGDEQNIPRGKMALALVRLSACDEQGERLFANNEEVGGTLDLADIGKIAAAVTELSGLSDGDSAKKNLTDGGSSPSG